MSWKALARPPPPCCQDKALASAGGGAHAAPPPTPMLFRTSCICLGGLRQGPTGPQALLSPELRNA